MTGFPSMRISWILFGVSAVVTSIDRRQIVVFRICDVQFGLCICPSFTDKQFVLLVWLHYICFCMLVCLLRFWNSNIYNMLFVSQIVAFLAFRFAYSVLFLYLLHLYPRVSSADLRIHFLILVF